MKAMSSPEIKCGLINLFLFLCFFSANAQNGALPPPTIMPGLEINRSLLISKMTSYDSTMVFKQEADVDGSSNFIGVDKYKTTIRLLGKENELILAKWTSAPSTDKNVILKEMDNLGYFTFVMGQQQSVDWIREKIYQIINNPTKTIVETHNFNYNRDAQLKYDPVSRIFILTIVQWGASFN